MATVLFDFDSTLVSCESLEEILKPRIANHPQIVKKIKNITEMGMDGKISFTESLQQRLKLTQLSKSDIYEFTRKAAQYLTFGMKSLISNLHRQNVELFIVSGGLKEAIIPVAKELHIPLDHIYAVQLIWDSKGNFVRIDADDKFSQSKVEGIKSLTLNWSKPRISIGDGMTDLALYDQYLVDHFILYTQHVSRNHLFSKAPNIASNVNELSILVEHWL